MRILVGLAAAALAAASAASAPPPPPPAGVPLLMHPSAFVKMSGFRVRHGHEAAFERRWAENTPLFRFSKGFRFFSLLRSRNLTLADPDDLTTPNYIASSIWDRAADWEVGAPECLGIFHTHSLAHTLCHTVSLTPYLVAPSLSHPLSRIVPCRPNAIVLVDRRNFSPSPPPPQAWQSEGNDNSRTLESVFNIAVNTKGGVGWGQGGGGGGGVGLG